MKMYCSHCDLVDTNGNSACRECYEELEPFEPKDVRFSVGVFEPEFMPAEPVYTEGFLTKRQAS